MKIRKIDKSVEEILRGAEYLGCGASKEAYRKDGIVYKVPRGRWILQNSFFTNDLVYPETMEDVDRFLEDVEVENGAMVWPLGQFAIELLVWEAVQQLRSEGLALDCFAEIKDYYIDRDGVIVIEQEETQPLHEYYADGNECDEQWQNLEKELELLEPTLQERFNISMRDIRTGNAGVVDGKVKLFDFRISTSASLDSYGSYSDFEYDSCSEDSYQVSWF